MLLYTLVKYMGAARWGFLSYLHWNVEAADFFPITLVALPSILFRVARHPELEENYQMFQTPVMPNKWKAYHSLCQGW